MWTTITCQQSWQPIKSILFYQLLKQFILIKSIKNNTFTLMFTHIGWRYGCKIFKFICGCLILLLLFLNIFIENPQKSRYVSQTLEHSSQGNSSIDKWVLYVYIYIYKYVCIYWLFVYLLARSLQKKPILNSYVTRLIT